MSFLPTTNKAGVLAGIYLVNAVVAPLAIFYNVSPQIRHPVSKKEKRRTS